MEPVFDTMPVTLKSPWLTSDAVGPPLVTSAALKTDVSRFDRLPELSNRVVVTTPSDWLVNVPPFSNPSRPVTVTVPSVLVKVPVVSISSAVNMPWLVTVAALVSAVMVIVASLALVTTPPVVLLTVTAPKVPVPWFEIVPEFCTIRGSVAPTTPPVLVNVPLLVSASASKVPVEVFVI